MPGPLLRRIATSKLFLAGCAVLLVYALAGSVLAPYLVERYLPGYAHETLGSKASVGHVRINPFLLRLEATDFTLEYPAGQPLVAFRNLLVDLQLSSVVRRAWTFAEVRVDGLQVAVEVARDGKLNLATFFDRVAKREADVSSGSETRLRWLVRELELHEAKVRYDDLSAPTPVRTDLAPINLKVHDLTSLPGRRGEYEVSAVLPDGGAIAWRGDVSLLPLASDGVLEAKGVKVATAWGFVREAVRVADPRGSIDAAARYRFAYAPAGNSTLTLDGIRAQVSDLAVRAPGGSEPIVAFDAIAVSDGRLDLAAREFAVPTLELRNGRVAAVLEADRSLDLAKLFAAVPSPSMPPPAAGAKPWQYSIGKIAVQNVSLGLVDRGFETPVTYGIDVVSATVLDIANRGDGPLRFEAALGIAPGGTVRASGTITRDLGTADAQVEAIALPLAPIRPLIARYAALDLKSGRASASARVKYRAGSEGPALSAIGAMGVDDLLLIETATGDRFLSWRTLSAEEASLTLAPNRLVVKEISIQEPGAKVVISKEREINLAQVLRPGVRAKDAKASAVGAFAADIGRVRVRNGTVDFADLSLALPFSARVRRFNGSAVGISTDRASRAEVKFDGRIEGSGSAKVEGGFNAFDPRSFTDVRVEFDNVEMPPLSPYAATFAGRKIAAGRLWLDLRYKIVNRELAGENRIVMQDFTLGERVSAPNALDLPLDLAIAVLTDSQGRINVAVPVRGNLDNPQFSYGRVIREALASFIGRIATAPFRALAGLSGSGEALGGINFEPARARLLPPEREKLDKVAQALRDKPQLKLLVHGPYDPRLDGEALRDRQVRRAVAERLGTKLGEREDPGPIAYGDAAVQRALEALLAERGPGLSEEFVPSFKQQSGRDPERVNRFTALFGKASPDREFYQAMFQHLVTSAPLPDAELQRLAARRAEAILDYLARSAGVDPGRMAAAEPRVAGSPSDQSVTAELALGLAKDVS